MLLKKFITPIVLFACFTVSAGEGSPRVMTLSEALICQSNGKALSIQNYKLNSLGQDLEIQRIILIKEHQALEQSRVNVTAETLDAYNASTEVYNFKARNLKAKLYEFSLEAGSHREAVNEFSASCSTKLIPLTTVEEICKAPIVINDIMCLSVKK